MMIIFKAHTTIRSLCTQALILSFFLGSVPSSVQAEAFRILDQSAAAMAQGTAFTAQADEPSAVYFNPAAMSQLPGIQMTFGTLLVNGDIDFTSSTGTRVEGDFGSAIANPPPSNFFVTANLGDLGFSSLNHITLGFGINSPFGNLTDYPTGGALALVLTSSASPLIDIKPTLAIELNEFLSVGFGLDIYTFSDLVGEGHVEFQQAGGDLIGTGLAFSTTDKIELNGTDTALGYNFSFLLTPFRNDQGKSLMNFAVVYRSQAGLNLEGQFLNQTRGIALDAKATLNLPQVMTTGLAVWPIRNAQREWKIEFDFDYVDWTSFHNLDVTLSNGLVLRKPRNWDPAHIFMLGTEYKLLNPAQLSNWDVAFRTGYVFSDSPVPETTFKPDVPDSNYHAYSVGLGLLCSGQGMFLGFIHCGNDGTTFLGTTAIGIDLAYQAIVYQQRGISNNDDSRVNGAWDTIIHVGALNLRTNFDLTR
jgi:long-chain fatty acid transport protein